MNIIRLASELFLLYILYKLIFDFIIPIYVASKKVKNQFGEMQQLLANFRHLNNIDIFQGSKLGSGYFGDVHRVGLCTV